MRRILSPAQPPQQKHLKISIYGGEDAIRVNSGLRVYAGGLIDEDAVLGIELASTLSATAAPSGLINREGFETLWENLNTLHREQPLDGMALTLHGVVSADGYQDITGEIIRCVRETFGPAMPMGVVLDLHGYHGHTDGKCRYSAGRQGLSSYGHL